MLKRAIFTLIILFSMLAYPPDNAHLALAQPGGGNAALAQIGQAWNWGQNDFGQLGNAATASQAFPMQPANLSDALAVAGGNSHSLAIRQDNSVWAWGANWAGQLGDNTTADKHTPVAVLQADGGSLTGAKAIAAGGSHSLALKTDGSVWAWGGNWYGQLGDNSTTDRHTPIQVKDSGGAGFLSNITAISAGDGHSLALKNDGTVWAWGDNYYGQLGDNTNSQRNTPVQVKGAGGSGYLTSITAVSAGAFFNLALKNDGTLWAWGQNDDGQLGDNTTTERAAPVQVLNISTASAIAAGGINSLALLKDATLRAWGDNTYGQLGDNTTTDRLTPVTVITGSGAFTGVANIAAGNAHSLAITNDNKAWAWGFNAYGQLGDTTFTDRHMPVPVTTLKSVIFLAAGYYHSLAIDNEPTAVNLAGFTVRWVDQHYQLAWQTALEINLAGFNILQAGSLTAKPVIINPSLILPQGHDQLSGATYTYAYYSPAACAYFWLEAVDVQGNTQRYGPAKITLVYLPLMVK